MNSKRVIIVGGGHQVRGGRGYSVGRRGPERLQEVLTHGDTDNPQAGLRGVVNFNPELQTEDTYQRFVINPPPNSSR